MHEQWYGGGVKKLSHQEIQRMKKNMKKVPELQRKSDEYHAKELQDVEKMIDEVHEEYTPFPRKEDEEIEEAEKIGFWKKWFEAMKNLLHITE